MNSRFATRFLLILGLSLNLSCSAVEVKSDLTPEEETELKIDETVTNAEEKRLEILLESVKISIHIDDLDEAVEFFRKITSSYKNQDNLTTAKIEDIGYSLAYEFIEAGKFRKGLKFADELLEFTGDDSIVFHIESLAYEGLRKNAEAAEWKEKALSHKADNKGYRFKVGRFFFFLKNYEVAEIEFRRMLELEPFDSGADVNANLFLGRIAYRRRKYEESLELFIKVAEYLKSIGKIEDNLGINREIIQAYLSAAREFEIRKEYEKELEVLQTAKKYYSGYTGLHNAIAASLLRLEKYDEAREIYEKLVELVPEYPEPFIGYGDVLTKLGRKEDAEKQFEKAIDLYTKYFEKEGAGKASTASNMNNLAWFYVTHDRDLEEGIRLSKRSLELKPEEPAYQDTLAELYYRIGDNKNAIKYIKEAIEKDPPHILYFQQQLEKFQGKSKTDADKSNREDEKDGPK